MVEMMPELRFDAYFDTGGEVSRDVVILARIGFGAT